MSRRTTTRIAAGGTLTLLLTPVVTGFSWYQSNGLDVKWAGGTSERYVYQTAFPPGTTEETLLLESMGLWNIVPATSFEYTVQLLPTDPPGGLDNFDGFSDTLVVSAAQLDPGTLGVTFLVNNGPNWFDMDIVFPDFPDNVGWNFEAAPACGVVADPDTHGYSFLLSATHEHGHAIGLGHEPTGVEPPGSPWFIATMNPRYPTGGPLGDLNIVELHTDDRNGVRYLYPPSGPSGPVERDLANANFTTGPELGKAIPVFFSPTSVAPEDLLVVRSVIENFGSSSEQFVRQGFYLSTDSTITTDDVLIGYAEWDIAFEDAFEFDVDIPLPGDLASGTYYLGSILDDTDTVDEVYEDNNTVVYCETLTIEQCRPEIVPLPQETIYEGSPYTGPNPEFTKPLNMAPAQWSIVGGPAGMTINQSTGVLSWANPVASEFLYVIQILVINDGGATVFNYFLAVEEEPLDCPGDRTTTGTMSGQPGFGQPDGTVNLSDLLYFVNVWQSDLGPTAGSEADVTSTGAAPGQPSFGEPDGQVDLSDLLFYVNQWSAGIAQCP